MSEPSQEPLPSMRPQPAALATAAHWSDDDLALGCECADPSLQIERWGQENAAAASSA